MADIKSLLDTMEQTPATSQWDIICSYSTDQLNQLLENAYNQSDTKMVKGGVFTKEDYDQHENPYTTKYDILFGSPKLEFIVGADATCIISMPIQKASCTVIQKGYPDETHSLEDNKYTLKANVRVVSLTGDGMSNTSNEIIQFDPGSGKTAYMYLHFNTTDLTTWTFTPPPDGQQSKYIWEEQFVEAIQNHYKSVNIIDYPLVGINNVLPQDKDIVIEPQSFLFSMYTDPQTKKGVLSIYIQTNGRQKGAAQPFFGPNGSHISPIPDGYGASLIFSREFMTEVFLAPRLKELSFNVTIKTEGVPKKISGILAAKKVKFTIPGEIVGKYSDTRIFVEDTQVNLESHPFTLDFQTSALHIQLKAEYSTGWTLDAANGGYPTDHHYTAKAEFGVDKTFSYPSITQMNDTTLNIDFRIDHNDYHTNIDPGYKASCWGEDYENHVSSLIRNGLNERIPKFTFSLDGLYYFKTTNLLFPGRQVLKMDANVGIHAPYDFIILGNVVPHF